METPKENCPCPSTVCPRKGYCQQCLESHLAKDSVPHCIFPAPKKDMSLFYKHLKERFEPELD